MSLSVTGDLKEIGRHYAPIMLQSRILYPTGAKLTATVTLPSGQKVEGTVVTRDEFTIALPRFRAVGITPTPVTESESRVA